MLEVDQTTVVPEDLSDRPVGEAGEALLPLHLHPYRDFARMRCVYPVCLHRAEEALRMEPLAALLDAVPVSTLAETDDAEQLRRALLKVEVAIREGASEEAPLGALWDEAVGQVLVATRAERRERLGALLEQARQALPKEATVVALSPAVAERFMWEIAAEHGRRLAARMGRDLQELTVRAEQLLALDDHARNADSASLETALAVGSNGELDVLAFADLIGKAALHNPLPEHRRTRVLRALKVIRGLEHVLAGEIPEAGLWAIEVATTVEAARARAEERLAVLADFFAAVHTAALEVDHRYRDEQHDAFFGSYELSAFERELCPPVLLRLEADAAVPSVRAELLDLLGSELPVKALVTLDRLYDESLRGAPWSASFATMTTALHHPYVAQVALSEVERLWAALSEGISFSGPALFCVFTGSGIDGPHVHAFLRSAAAVEGRAFPVFEYAPSRSREPGERWCLDGNPQPEQAWRVEAVTYGAGEHETTEDLPFTLADFLACDGRLASHFGPVLAGRHIEAMVPLDQYLSLPPAESRGRVPFILAAEGDGEPVRLIVSTAVVEATRRAATAWRSLQEAAGINSVHARRALEGERERLEAEKQQAIDEIRRAHDATLEESTGKVAERVVATIAARLLNLTAAPAEAPALRAAPAPRPAAPSPGAVPAAAVEPPEVEPEPEEEEPLALDEPYIETPRCTSCNECTNINGRMFAYDGNKQAYIADTSAGTYREMVLAAEKCPVDIIHPGKPWNPAEAGLDELMKRAGPYL
jgi:ferredoxin